ncbi:proprotein convertase subtilisin/kexin type 6 isoform X3 [Callorhinchus milii]|uniref:proprotein convertase subtilisin/kexin type 6 isoform X3 n=1 Tax=Callorhinchus milii TaxID=7868 RepID=UPI001C3F95F0|nr:proprotein convertase subtilisin/kexin type 6 isoform X3 [Callorhinchus milii]
MVVVVVGGVAAAPLVLLISLCDCLSPRPLYTNHWAVRIPSGGGGEADRLAAKYGFVNLGQIGSLKDHYHFHHSKTFKRSTVYSRGIHAFIHLDSKVEWVEQQVIKRRVKRHAKKNFSLHFTDPEWSSMWYIHCEEKNKCRSEMNVLGAWQKGYTGRNVVVTILDDGIERMHPDLMQNYDPLASYDVNGNDDDPTPRYDVSNENKHGTRCAGEVAAIANNSHCAVGIAYNANIGGIRMLDGYVTDITEAQSLSIRPNHIDIYSASWGPDDDGKTVDGPGALTRQALERGIRTGRNGLGSIFIWASGNGGRRGDHCSCDGYTNSIYTISISSATEKGNKPWYLEECASTLATTYSSGEYYDRKIVTTDLRQGCTDGHTGTSVSAPMMAGCIALVLEANPLLTWRDVQHILVKTARPVHLKAPDWKVNAAGHKVSHLYGFGLVDAEAMVIEAENWRTVPTHHVCRKTSNRQVRFIRPNQLLRVVISTDGCSNHSDQWVKHLEHVVVQITLSHPKRGNLQISLISPSGTKSQLLSSRYFDNSMDGFLNWEFMTVHCWGERVEGEWTLEIYDTAIHLRPSESIGKLKKFKLLFHGTAEHPYYPNAENEHQNVPQVGEEERGYAGPCHAECDQLACDGPEADNCLNCVNLSLGTTGSNRNCVQICPIGFYADSRAGRCLSCDRTCETCVGKNQSDCHLCKRGYFYYEELDICQLSCPSGFFTDEIERRCQNCPENCAECTESAENCTVCREGFSLLGSLCAPECDIGTYLNMEEMQCDSCADCLFCLGPGPLGCINCQSDSVLQDQECVSTCNEGFYPQNVHGLHFRVCKRCNEITETRGHNFRLAKGKKGHKEIFLHPKGN